MNEKRSILGSLKSCRMVKRGDKADFRHAPLPALGAVHDHYLHWCQCHRMERINFPAASFFLWTGCAASSNNRAALEFAIWSNPSSILARPGRFSFFVLISLHANLWYVIWMIDLRTLNF